MSVEMNDSPTEIALLSHMEAARMLGVKPSRVKQLIRDNFLIGLRQGNDWLVPQLALVEADSELARSQGAQRVLAKIRLSESEELERPSHVPLWMLFGTVTVLKDCGFSTQEVFEWITSYNPLIKERPIEAMHAGRVHLVNQVASAEG